MERKVEREAALPAFAIDVPELEVLWGQLAALLSPPAAGDKFRSFTIIELDLPNEQLRFDSMEEFKAHAELKGAVSKFSLYMHSGNQNISFAVGGVFGQPRIRATGDSAAWCAGVVDVTRSFFQSHRAWYSWLASAPLMPIALLFPATLFLMSAVFPQAAIIESRAGVAGWLVTFFAILFLSAFQSKLFPFGRLHITREENFIRRYSAELGVTLSGLALVVSLLGLFLNK